MAVKNFVASIPQILLARASFGCEGYARSLMHFESHLREKPDENLLETSLPELQKIYGALMEPDYVAGLSMIRKSKPSLEEMIHEHTVMANFQVKQCTYVNYSGRPKSGRSKTRLVLNPDAILPLHD